MDPLCKSQIYGNTKQIIVTWTDGSANPDILLDESRVQLPKKKVWSLAPQHDKYPQSY